MSNTRFFFARKLIAMLVLAASTLLLGPTAYAINPEHWAGYETETMRVAVPTSQMSGAPIVELQPLVLKPTGAPPWNAVVMPSNCTGLSDRMWRVWAPELVKAGIAVVLLDSFNPRGFSSLCDNQLRLAMSSRIADAHHVLAALRKDERFASGKIALIGHSVGAVTAFQSAFRQPVAMLGLAPIGYDAFVGAAASCSQSFREPALWGPLLLISGEKDDYTPAAPCEQEVRRLQAAGQQADISVIQGANHSFSTRGQQYDPRVMKYPEGAPVAYFKRFARTANSAPTLMELEDGREVTTQQLIEEYGGLMKSRMYGAHVGGAWDKVGEVVTRTVEFLKRLGW